jgi:hypothetical protein
MKTVITLFGLMLLLSTISLSQTAGDSTRTSEHQRSRRVIDENGDGINDRRVEGQQRLRKGIDGFLDANGDGISDGRESGLGFRRGRMAQQTEPGKQGLRKGQKGK